MLAERLASHGIAVIAADHSPNTLFDVWNQTFDSVNASMLDTRVADVRYALDLALDPSAYALPAELRGHFDAAHVGAFGHSFGALTTGRILQEDQRVLAGLAVAAPLSSPMPGGPDLSLVAKPMLLILAKEDGSIFEIGNQFIRNNFKAAPGPAWLLEVADAGHFSFSDIPGLDSEFQPGCGPATRQTDGTAFTFVDPAKTRELAAQVVARYFAKFLLQRPGAMDHLADALSAAASVQQK